MFDLVFIVNYYTNYYCGLDATLMWFYCAHLIILYLLYFNIFFLSKSLYRDNYFKWPTLGSWCYLNQPRVYWCPFQNHTFPEKINSDQKKIIHQWTYKPCWLSHNKVFLLVLYFIPLSLTFFLSCFYIPRKISNFIHKWSGSPTNGLH